jgi:large subunit ribosomal protein L21
MYAIFQLSGFQFTGEEGSVIRVPRQDVEKGGSIDISEVLLVKGDGDPMVGTPYVADASIQAEVVDHGKDDKILVHKYKRRTKYRLTRGHRQDYSEIKINKISAPGL